MANQENGRTSTNWADVKPAEGIEGVEEEEGDNHKVVVNYPGGQVTTPNQS